MRTGRGFDAPGGAGLARVLGSGCLLHWRTALRMLLALVDVPEPGSRPIRAEVSSNRAFLTTGIRGAPNFCPNEFRRLEGDRYRQRRHSQRSSW
jgi:hypothetical protein